MERLQSWLGFNSENKKGVKDKKCRVHARISESPGVFRMKFKTIEREDIKELRGQSAGWINVWILKPPKTINSSKVSE